MYELEKAIKAKDEARVLQMLSGLKQTGMEQITDGGICLTTAIEENLLNVVKKLLPYYSRRTIDNCSALMYACSVGNLEIVQAIIPHCDVSFSNNLALFKSVQHNHLSITQALVVHCDLSQEHPVFSALFEAVKEDTRFLDCVIPYYKANSKVANEALLRAINRENLPALVRLVRIGDPNYKEGLAIRLAIHAGHQDMFDVLYPLVDAPAILAVMQAKKEDPAMLQARMEKEALNQSLNEQLRHHGISKARKI